MSIIIISSTRRPDIFWYYLFSIIWGNFLKCNYSIPCRILIGKIINRCWRIIIPISINYRRIWKSDETIICFSNRIESGYKILSIQYPYLISYNGRHFCNFFSYLLGYKPNWLVCGLSYNVWSSFNSNHTIRSNGIIGLKSFSLTE